MYLVFTGRFAWLSFLIGLFTRSVFPRLAWSLPLWCSHMAVEGVLGQVCSKIEADAKTGKVTLGPARHYPGAYGWRVNLGPLYSADGLRRAWSRSKECLGLPYDDLGILWYVFRSKRLNRHDSLYCFEVIERAFPELAGGKHPSRVTARHFWKGLKRLAKERGVKFADLVEFF
mgnify:CR=1 FL=1